MLVHLHSLILASLWVRPHLQLEAHWCIAVNINDWGDQKIKKCSSTSLHFQKYTGRFLLSENACWLMWFQYIPNPLVKCRCHRCLQKQTFKVNNLNTTCRGEHVLHVFVYLFKQRTKTQRQLTIGIVHVIINVSFPIKTKNIRIFYPSIIKLTCYIYYECNPLCCWSELNWWYLREKNDNLHWKKKCCWHITIYCRGKKISLKTETLMCFLSKRKGEENTYISHTGCDTKLSCCLRVEWRPELPLASRSDLSHLASLSRH